jgi:hypothetical protein
MTPSAISAPEELLKLLQKPVIESRRFPAILKGNGPENHGHPKIMRAESHVLMSRVALKVLLWRAPRLPACTLHNETDSGHPLPLHHYLGARRMLIAHTY